MTCDLGLRSRHRKGDVLALVAESYITPIFHVLSGIPPHASLFFLSSLSTSVVPSPASLFLNGHDERRYTYPEGVCTPRHEA